MGLQQACYHSANVCTEAWEISEALISRARLYQATETCCVGSASTKPLCIYIYMVQGLDYITAVYSVTTINKIKLTSIQYNVLIVHACLYNTKRGSMGSMQL